MKNPSYWRDISYLHLGSDQQKSAFDTLCKIQVLSRLSKYDPVLVSSICLDIATAKSDLDITCEVYDRDAFIAEITQLCAQFFGHTQGVSWRRSTVDPSATVVCFTALGFEIEIFGKPQPVEKQPAFRHLCQVARIIDLGGERCRVAIKSLKKQGLKTEPAVAKLLALPGNPYEAILTLEHFSDAALTDKISLIVF